MNVGDLVHIQSFKHNGSLHRTWSKGIVLDIKDDCWIIVTYKTMVIEANKRMWQTREPAICFFYPHRWYNVIAMIRKIGITYYCNVASPCLYDEEAIKYIDYDLDLKLYPNGYYEVLDEDEFKQHALAMNYPSDIMTICEQALRQLIELAKNQKSPFDAELIESYYYQYLQLNRHRLK